MNKKLSTGMRNGYAGCDISGITEISRIKALVQANIVFYSLTLLLAFLGKAFYSLASTSQLLFLLSPITWLVSAFTGVPFQYHDDSGFVNVLAGIIIGKSCSGLNYLIILFCMINISLIHYYGRFWHKVLFQVASLAGSYLVSIYVTTARILISVLLIDAAKWAPFMKTSIMHKITGIFVYVVSLLVCYHIINGIAEKRNRKEQKQMTLKH